MFICGGSISGFSAAAAETIVPLKVISATSVYAVETEPEVPKQTRDLILIARRHTQAYERARERLQTQASGVCANMVLDVQVTKRSLEKNICELTLIGTAAKAYQREFQHLPIITGLTCPQYHLLMQYGFAPQGMAFGICVYGQRVRPSTQRKLRTGTYFATWEQINGERKEYSDAVKKAQRLAIMTRLREDAGELECEEVIAIRLQPQRTVRRNVGCIVTVEAMGEAVACVSPTHPDITTAVSLNI